MLGLIVLYFIGKAYYNLALQHNRSAWGYAVLGVIAYYGGTFIGGIIIAIAMEVWGSTPVEEMDDTALGFMALPFGILICWGLYKYFEKSWNRPVMSSNPDILDEDFID